jgi:hypothetical protein
MAELRNFVISTLSPRLDELKTALLTKIQTQEEQLNQKLKKLEGEDDKALAGAGGAGGADKGGKKDAKAVKPKK